MHPCLDQYNADKAIDGNGGMRRIRGAAAITASRPTPEVPKIEGKWRRKAIFFPSERSWVTLAPRSAFDHPAPSRSLRVVVGPSSAGARESRGSARLPAAPAPADW
jgi:hypothetical protein